MGCKREQIAQWRTAARVPGVANRARLRDEFGIAVESWDQYGRGQPAEPEISPSEAPVIDDGSVTAKAKRLDRLVRAGLDMLESDKTLTNIERFRLATDTHQLLDKMGKLTGETQLMPESRILKLPAWRRIQDAVLVALKPHPKALAAFVKTLEDLGGEA